MSQGGKLAVGFVCACDVTRVSRCKSLFPGGGGGGGKALNGILKLPYGEMNPNVVQWQVGNSTMLIWVAFTGWSWG